MICPNCSASYEFLPCPACQWQPTAKPMQLVPQAKYAYLLTPHEQAYGQFRIDLFKRGRASGHILQITADALECWLAIPTNEDWAAQTVLAQGCPDHPSPHSLLTCLLEEIQSYRESNYTPPASHWNRPKDVTPPLSP